MPPSATKEIGLYSRGSAVFACYASLDVKGPSINQVTVLFFCAKIDLLRVNCFIFSARGTRVWPSLTPHPAHSSLIDRIDPVQAYGASGKVALSLPFFCEVGEDNRMDCVTERWG